jgi:hypothetical protein
MGVDGVQLGLGELQIVEGRDILRYLIGSAGSNERRGHAAIPQNPSQSHLRERLATRASDIVQRPDPHQVFFAEMGLL